MKKLLSVFTLCLIVSCVYSQGVYRQEFKDFKQSELHSKMFDKDIPKGVRKLYKQIENYKEVSYWSRLVRAVFFALDVIVVTRANFPNTYTFIDTLCKKSDIKTPVIFVTAHKGFFNAAAQKLFTSSGGIVIGQDFFLDLSDEQLEGVIAHEIGHIKHNHVNQMLLLSGVTTGLLMYACEKLHITSYRGSTKVGFFCQVFCVMVAADIIDDFIINKGFEKEADAFAYKENDYGQGLMEFFESSEEKKARQDQSYDDVYRYLENNQPYLSEHDYFDLQMQCVLNQFGHMFARAYQWIYRHTPLGAHPSNEARIAAIKEYLENR